MAFKPIPELEVRMILRLLLQGMSCPAIGRWLRFTTKRVEYVRGTYGKRLKQLDGRIVYEGDPGTGEFGWCRFCQAQVRMPCIHCAFKALNPNRTNEGWEP